MNPKFAGISTTGIITPGNFYIFFEYASSDIDLDLVKLLYAIQKEQEILPALDLEMRTWAAASYDLKSFLNISKISNDCHEFKMFVYDKEEDVECEYSLYFHRIMTFEEKLQRAKEFFSEPSLADTLGTIE